MNFKHKVQNSPMGLPRENEFFKMQEIEECKANNKAIDIYLEEFEKRYKVKFIFGNQDSLILKDIVKATGERAGGIIRAYFKNDDPWFIKHAHSIDVLKKNLNVLNASLGDKKHGSTKKLLLKDLITCSKCQKYFEWEFTVPEVFNLEPVCDECS